MVQRIAIYSLDFNKEDSPVQTGFCDSCRMAIFLISPFEHYRVVSADQEVDQVMREVDQVTREFYYTRTPDGNCIWNSSKQVLLEEIQKYKRVGPREDFW